MSVAHVIIGANYGDEGKGLLTDHFASFAPGETMVVRFNGGAQAGHTVVAPDGRRHVFSHFGAGSFSGCTTYLSRFFIVNPIVFVREHKQLIDLGLVPKVIICSRALLTTPYDIFINQSLELMRGESRHGSCGLGINETVTRCLRDPRLKTEAGDIFAIPRLRQKLLELGRSWLPHRIDELGIDCTSSPAAAFLVNHDLIVEQFLEDLRGLKQLAVIAKAIPESSNFVFEGAQGLLLDEDRIDQWPFVTRSRTGLKNVLFLSNQMQIDHLNVTYVSRSYLTRHGAGPLDGEADWHFDDTTNVENRFQGKLRFAPIDLNQLRQSVDLDLRSAKGSGLSIEASLAITCCDQIPLPAGLDAGIPIRYNSFGPSRLDVQPVTDCPRVYFQPASKFLLHAALPPAEMENQKVDPLPTSLLTPTSPP